MYSTIRQIVVSAVAYIPAVGRHVTTIRCASTVYVDWNYEASEQQFGNNILLEI